MLPHTRNNNASYYALVGQQEVSVSHMCQMQGPRAESGPLGHVMWPLHPGLVLCSPLSIVNTEAFCLQGQLYFSALTDLCTHSRRGQMLANDLHAVDEVEPSMLLD